MTSKRVAGAAAPGSFTPIQVASHPKNTRETYRVLITEYKGRKYIDARVWAGRDDVEMTATTKDLSLKFADAAWLAAAADEAGPGSWVGEFAGSIGRRLMAGLPLSPRQNTRAQQVIAEAWAKGVRP
jgi:hypothetical protein